MRVGSDYLGDGRCEFVVWAPKLKNVALKLILPAEREIPMEQDSRGYWRTVVEDVFPGALYLYRLEDGMDRTDPASHFQPRGVHEPSEVVDHNSFDWEDYGWRGISLSEMISYELHIGTFTADGTFDAVIPRIPEVLDFGINAIEIMPVAQFPGERNWGYDGTYPFAVQNSYGGPNGLKRLVNECHKKGAAVILDVVYNHLGPEGNYMRDFGPYFTDKYKIPWGKAINFDDAYSDDVRNFFIENAFYWFEHYHIDALRLDAIHAIYDMSAKPFLQELAERVEEFSSRQGRKFYLIAESDLNDSRVIRPRELGGYGIDAHWCDDFHHSMYTLFTGKKEGYYIDFGKIELFVKSLREGFVYSGQYSTYRKKRHGTSSKDMPAEQFIIFSQNHDQVGNRMFGERLSALVSFEALKLAAGTVLLSPYIPLLFMGEEYGEDAPFHYFVSHSDPGLIEAVRKGRDEEIRAFVNKEEPPDPQSAETFLKSKIDWGKRKNGNHRIMLGFYKHLIKLRREIPALLHLDKDTLDVRGFEKEKVIFMRRWKDNSHVFIILNFNIEDMTLKVSLPGGKWVKILESSDSCWNGTGMLLPENVSQAEAITMRGHSVAMYIREVF